MSTHWTKPETSGVAITVLAADRAGSRPGRRRGPLRADAPHLLVRPSGGRRRRRAAGRAGSDLMPALRRPDPPRRRSRLADPARTSLPGDSPPVAPAVAAWAAGIAVTQVLSFLAGARTGDRRRHGGDRRPPDYAMRWRSWPPHRRLRMPIGTALHNGEHGRRPGLLGPVGFPPGGPAWPPCPSASPAGPPSASASDSAARSAERGHRGDAAARRRAALPGAGRAQGWRDEVRAGAEPVRGGPARRPGRLRTGRSSPGCRTPRPRCPPRGSTPCWPGSSGPTGGPRSPSFEPLPAAAASIGQVHRAVWADGRPVAVKVQYPGADEALRSDLQARSGGCRRCSLRSLAGWTSSRWSTS